MKRCHGKARNIEARPLGAMAWLIIAALALAAGCETLDVRMGLFPPWGMNR